MFNLPPNLGDVMASYKGRLVPSFPAEPGSDCVVLDGVRVPKLDLDALFFEDVHFDWEGERFLLGRYLDGRVSGIPWNLNETWIKAHKEIEGDYYSGYFGWFPESDIKNVRVVKHDLLAAWRHEKEVGMPAPQGLYAYERPATAEEWVKD